MKKYVIKAVGYNMWVSKVVRDLECNEIPPAIYLTLKEEKRMIFEDKLLADMLLEILNKGNKDVEYIAKEVEE